MLEMKLRMQCDVSERLGRTSWASGYDSQTEAADYEEI
jgi:hypothetical protein